MKKPNPLLEDLKAILPAIAANAARAEQLRRVPDENIALLKGIGLHRALLYNEALGTVETFRPYAEPESAWWQECGELLKPKALEV